MLPNARGGKDERPAELSLRCEEAGSFPSRKVLASFRGGKLPVTMDDIGAGIEY